MTKPMMLAWLLYFASMSLTGVLFQVGSAAIRLEHFCLPLLVLMSVQMRRKHPVTGTQVAYRHSYGLLVLVSVWVLVALAVTLLRAPDVSKSLWILIQISTGMLCFSLVRPWEMEKKRQLIVIGTGFLALLCGVSIFGYLLVSFAGIPPSSVIGVAPDLRLVGLSFEPNIFASQIVAWLAVVFYWRKVLPRWTKLASVLMLVAVVLAGTRAAWLALIILAAFWILAGYAQRPLRTIFFMFPVLAFAILLLTYAPTGLSTSAEFPLLERFVNILNTESGTGAYRLQIYDIARNDIATSDRWLFGSGLNTFSQYNVTDPTNTGAAYLSSIWWALLYDVGLVGLTVFVLIVVVALLRAKRRREAIAVFAIVLICASTTNIIWFVYPWMYWALLDYRVPADRVRYLGMHRGTQWNKDRSKDYSHMAEG